MWKTHTVNDVALKRLRKRQTFWDLSIILEAQLYHSLQKGTRVLSICIFPRDVFGSEGKLYYILKMIGINIDFQTGEKLEM